MVNKVLLSLATVALFAATAKATGYEVVSTNAWFTAGGSTDSKWTATASGTTNWVGGTVTVDSAANDPLVYAPAAATADGYRIKANVKFTYCASAPSDVPSCGADPVAALGALAIANGTWYGVQCGESAEWVPLYGAAVPSDNSEAVDVTLDFKTNGVQKLVRYTVGTTVLTNASGVAWLTRGRDSANVTKVGIAGYGELASLSGDTVSYFEITTTATAEDLVAAGIIDDEETPVTEAVLNETGANDLPKWQSLVLGLNASDSTSKPFVAPVQTGNANTLGFTIGNAEIGKYGATGATVTFDVVACNQDGSGEIVIDQASAKNVPAGGTATVTPDSTGVKYYKIKIKIAK